MSSQYSLSNCFHNSDSEKDFFAPDGSWLCADGDYRHVLAHACRSDPGLRKPDMKNRIRPLGQGHSRVVMLEMSHTGSIQREAFADPVALRNHFVALDKRRPSPARRVYILEGLHPGYVSLLGSQFNLDPSMFMRQERTSVFASEHEHANENTTLPSSRSQDYLYLRYFEVLNFGGPLPSFQVSCADTGRHVGVSQFLGHLQPNAVVRRKASFWSKPREGGGWDAVILCDPPIKELLWGNESDGLQRYDVQPMPFQGGYVDFVPFDQRKADTLGPPRSCLLEDFVYYFTTYSDKLNTSDASCASLFVKKLIATHFLEFSSYIRGLVYHHSWLLSRRKQELTEDDLHVSELHWTAAQGLSLRCAQYVDDMECNQIELQISPNTVTRHRDCDWTQYECDYHYVYERMKGLQKRADTLTASLGGLASMAANRLSQDDGRRAQMLTFVGLVFIPLAYVTGLFSMGDGFTPGQDRFWVYFAVAIPAVLLVLLLTFLLNQRFRMDFAWSPRDSFTRLVSDFSRWRKAHFTSQSHSVRGHDQDSRHSVEKPTIASKAQYGARSLD